MVSVRRQHQREQRPLEHLLNRGAIGDSVASNEQAGAVTENGHSGSQVELFSGGGSNYSATDSWTLPQGARDFEAHVNCSTDDSSPTCYFADSIAVPALSDITLTLADDTPPVIKSASGPLATAAADKSTVAGSQTLSFTAGDVDSGVRSATLTLTPQDGETPIPTHSTSPHNAHMTPGTPAPSQSPSANSR